MGAVAVMLLGLFPTEREVVAVLALEVRVEWTLFLLVIRPSSVASSSTSSSDTT